MFPGKLFSKANQTAAFKMQITEQKNAEVSIPSAGEVLINSYKAGEQMLFESFFSTLTKNQISESLKVWFSSWGSEALRAA